mgnify:CR=1 FL=1
MKLSFSTKGWHNKSFDEFCNIARELKFGGIELHNINGELFKNKDGAFHGYAAAATVRRLYEMKLELPCIDVISDICEEGAIAETESCIKIAEDLHAPNIRIKSAECDSDTAKKFITAVLPKAEKAGVTLVIETSGAFSNTAVLRELLDSSVKLMDGKSPLEIQLPGPLNALKKPLLKLVKGNVIEKVLRDHNVLKDGM